MMADHAERETCMIPPLRPDTRIPVRPARHNVCIRRFPTPDPTLNVLPERLATHTRTLS